MIRKATVDDIDKLLEIERSSFKHGAWNRNHFRRLIRSGKGQFYVYEINEKYLVGYIYVTPNGRILSIASTLACGIGSQLLDHIEQQYVKLHLEVCESNQKAIRFYERHGYIQYGTKTKYYDNGETALLYKKDFSNV